MTAPLTTPEIERLDIIRECHARSVYFYPDETKSWDTTFLLMLIDRLMRREKVRELAKK